MLWEGIPYPWSSCAKSPISHSAELGLSSFEGESVARAERAGGGWRFDQFLEVGRGIAVDALMGEESDLVFYSEGDGKPV